MYFDVVFAVVARAVITVSIVSIVWCHPKHDKKANQQQQFAFFAGGDYSARYVCVCVRKLGVSIRVSLCIYVDISTCVCVCVCFAACCAFNAPEFKTYNCFA